MTLKITPFLINLLLVFTVSATRAQVPMLRLEMSGGNNNLDETVIYYQAGATTGFDSQYDAYKLNGPNPTLKIGQNVNGILMQINGISPVIQTVTINIKTTTNISSTFTITASDFYFLPTGTCVQLQDLFTGQTTDILSSSYTFQLSDTTISDRFKLHITRNDLLLNTQVNHPTCTQSSNEICVQANSSGPWNYTWKDANANIIKQVNNKSAQDTLKNLFPGIYSVEVKTVGGCDFGTDTFQIIYPVKPIADFSIPDSICLTDGDSLIITDESINGISYSWDFGDGFGMSMTNEPSYLYNDTGTYIVTLILQSIDGCVDTISKPVTVYSGTISTRVEEQVKADVSFSQISYKTFLLRVSSQLQEHIIVSVLDINGRNVKVQQATGATTILNLHDLHSGVYLLKCFSNGNCIKTKLFTL